MPVNAKAVVDIEVNDSQFKEFQTAFDKYVKLLARQPAAWKQMSSDQKAMVGLFQQGTAALMAQGEIMRKNAAHAKDVSIHSEKAHFDWKGITERGKKFGEFVLTAHEKIMKWGGILGGIMTGMGAATSWGLYGLGQWMRGGIVSAGRVGMGQHELRAVKGQIGDPYGVDVEGIAKMVSTAQGNPGSEQYRALAGILHLDPSKLKGTKKVTSVVEAIIREIESGRMTPETMEMFSGGVLNASDTTAIMSNKAGVRRGIARVPEEAEKNKIDQKTQDAWNDFITQLESATTQLRTILVKGLTPLLDIITKNSPMWIEMFDKFMNDPNTKEFLEKLPGRLAYAFNVIVEQLTWVAEKLGWIKKSDEEERSYQELKANKVEGPLTEEQMFRLKQDKQWAMYNPANIGKGLGIIGSGIAAGAEAVHDAFDDKKGATGVMKFLGDMTGAVTKGVVDGFAFFGQNKQIDLGTYNLGSHQDGIPMVPKTGTYTLHGGEMVLPSADADLLRHSTMADWKRAISGNESGGSYGIMNSKGSGATGKYQVMPGNIAAWTKAALGYSMSQEQFRNSPMAQERVFETIFGGYVQRYGNPIDAASAWFTGQPFSGNRSGPDAMGTTLPGYIRSFMQGMGATSAGRVSVDINDNTGGNVGMALSQMATVALPLHPV